jgi:hypothetical protein
MSSIKAAVTILTFLICVSNLSCGEQREIEPKLDSPPVITSVVILPEKPDKENELSLVIQSRDPDGDPVIYHYQWFKNDEEISGENKNILKSGNSKKGDLIRVRVTSSDGKVDGQPFLSDPVKILNSPSVIQEVSIEPKVAYATDDLKVSVKSSDVDGDFVNYTYQWEKNGVILAEERKDILEKGRFKKGDSITVVVTPDDREATGKAKKSEPVVVSNSPPIIISSPPSSVEGTTFVYQVKTNDPDDDSILFILKSSSKGMEIDKNAGLIRWEIRKEDKGSHLIEIEASDSTGAKSFQRFTVVVRN